jgi:hypothetical protein
MPKFKPVNTRDPARRAIAELRMPPIHVNDTCVGNTREVFIRRHELGFGMPGARTMNSISSIGYDATLIKLVNDPNKIGKSEFARLKAAGHLDLTSEFVAFNYFRDYLSADVRPAIAKLLLESGVAQFFNQPLVSQALGSKYHRKLGGSISDCGFRSRRGRQPFP